MEYMIIHRPKTEELAAAVNAYISQKGWEPIGGVTVCPGTDRWPDEFYRAMIKRNAQSEETEHE